jgi:L-rhamnose mutarotase
MKRMGLCNRLRSEKAEEYKRLHAAAYSLSYASLRM